MDHQGKKVLRKFLIQSSGVKLEVPCLEETIMGKRFIQVLDRASKKLYSLEDFVLSHASSCRHEVRQQLLQPQYLIQSFPSHHTSSGFVLKIDRL